MYCNLREIRSDARNLIKTGRVSPVMFTLFFLLLRSALSLLEQAASYHLSLGPRFGFSFLSLSFAGILVSLITNVLSAGYRCYCLGLCRREHMPYDSLFDAFSFAGKVIALLLVQSLFVFLWSLLFFFPGVVAAFRYSFALWNLCDNPSMGVLEALRASKHQTRGYKLKLLALYLHFTPWYLAVLTVSGLYARFIYPLLPLGFSGLLLHSLAVSLISGAFCLYLMPYILLSIAGLYLRATGQFYASSNSGWSSPF